MSEFENNKYNLEDRTIKFSGELISFCNSFPKNIITIPIINQLIRCGTSVGANYREANGASSRKDFHNKIFICKKESKETLYWLELLEGTVNDIRIKEKCKKLQQEAKEFVLIFGKISHSTKK